MIEAVQAFLKELGAPLDHPIHDRLHPAEAGVARHLAPLADALTPSPAPAIASFVNRPTFVPYAASLPLPQYHLFNICSRNITGKGCRTGLSCLEAGRSHICPHYNINGPDACAFGNADSHEGIIHTDYTCVHVVKKHMAENQKLRGIPNCMQVARLVHFKSTCVAVRRNKPCFDGEDCPKGHDLLPVRRQLMLRDEQERAAKKAISEGKETGAELPPYEVYSPGVQFLEGGDVAAAEIDAFYERQRATLIQLVPSDYASLTKHEQDHRDFLISTVRGSQVAVAGHSAPLPASAPAPMTDYETLAFDKINDAMEKQMKVDREANRIRRGGKVEHNSYSMYSDTDSD